MKPGYAALISLVQTATELPFAECFTITLIDGTVLRYTNLDVGVWLNGSYFAANGVRIQGLKFKQTTGVDIDEQEIDLICSAADTIKGVPVLQGIREHVLDGAYVQRDRAFFNPATNWPPNLLTGAVAAGGVTMFKGRVAAVTALGRTTAQINLKSDLVLLDIDFPRNLWQASCLHTLYDSGCGLNKANFQSVGVAGAGATNISVPCSLGGSGAVLSVNMSGTAGSAISRVILTSSTAANQAYLRTPPVITVTDPTGSGAVLRPLMSFFGTGLYGVLVVNGGANYTNPTIHFSYGAATATAVLAAGSQSISSIGVSNGGGGYSNASSVQLSGGGGTGAVFTPVIVNGVLTSVIKINGGSGFNSAPSAALVDTPANNFSMGTLLWQGGQNAGVLCQVKSASATGITLAQPLNYAPASGDVFNLWAGCDHSRGPGGCLKFNNLSNFRGFPEVPPPDITY
jgi:hypothetical protein